MKRFFTTALNPLLAALSVSLLTGCATTPRSTYIAKPSSGQNPIKLRAAKLAVPMRAVEKEVPSSEWGASLDPSTKSAHKEWRDRQPSATPQVAKKPQIKSPSVKPRATGGAFYSNSGSRRLSIFGNSSFGRVILLSDGSVWKIAPLYQHLSSIWLYAQDVTVIGLGGRRAKLIYDDDVAEAQLLGVRSRSASIDGDFEGWDGDTIVKLADGTLWKQSGGHYEYSYSYSPQVIVLNNEYGVSMLVDGTTEPVAVTQLRSLPGLELEANGGGEVEESQIGSGRPFQLEANWSDGKFLLLSNGSLWEVGRYSDERKARRFRENREVIVVEFRRSSGRAKLVCQEEVIQAELLAEDTLEVQLDNDFEGWEGETIVELTTGHIFKQTDYHYEYTYDYMPKALLFESSYGATKILIEDTDEAVGVVRVR